MSDKFTSIDERASYGVGRQMGEQLASQPFDGMQVDSVLEGIADSLAGRPSQVSDADMRVAIDDLNQRMLRQQQEQAGVQSAEGEAFLEQNATREEIVITDSGLQYEIITAGEGPKPEASSKVKVHYHGTLIDGSVFDSSVERGEPLEFPVNGVIAGWTEALQLMSAGSKWKLYIPHELAYGANGAGGMIGPYAALIFEVELLDVL
ncbi:FKBP-type peptidyl-prolyl cis-trans isomerase [Gammaproteobacteria bacterium]|nr:FKBP-type peptidyl-prolyl cis-trans isomerase [Gammaproteobacteria bacterium]